MYGKAGVSPATGMVYKRLAVLVAAYLVIGEAVDAKDVRGEKVLKALKAMAGFVNMRNSLKEVVALYAYAIGAAISSLLQDVTKKFAEIGIAAGTSIERLREIRGLAEKAATSALYPEEVAEILKIRLKAKGVGDGAYMNFDQVGVADILNRVQFLMETAEIAVEKGRSDVLDTQSRFLRAALSIVREGGSDTWERQVALELLSLHYERNFINEMLKDIQDNKMGGANSMIFGLFNKCLPNIIEAINAIVKNAEANRLADLKVGDVLKARAKLLMALYIIGPETVASIVFSNLVRISGSGGGAEEMDLINRISEAVFINMKHKRKIVHKLPKAVKAIWAERREGVITLSAVDKVEVGQTLLDICLQCCHKLFEKVSRMVSRDERVNWIVIKKEFTVYMANFAFNPIRLPMLYKPND